MDNDSKNNVDDTIQNLFKEELQTTQEAIIKSTELKLYEYEGKRTQAATDVSLELKRYIEWEINNAVSDLKSELNKIVEDESKKTLAAFAETSKELKRYVETATENTTNTVMEQGKQITETFTEVSSELKKCMENAEVGKKTPKSEKSDFDVIYEHLDKIIPSRGNLLTTISALGKEYHVHFIFTPGSTSTGCRNIFHMSAGGNGGQYGGCIPSVNFLSAKQCFTVISAVNGEASHKQNTVLSLPAEDTYVIDVIQEHNEGKYYTYKIFLNDNLMYAVLNSDARDFNMVNVYVSDPWTQEQPGVMNELIIKTRL